MNIEEKLNAIIEYILAGTEEEKEKAVALLKNEGAEKISQKKCGRRD